MTTIDERPTSATEDSMAAASGPSCLAWCTDHRADELEVIHRHAVLLGRFEVAAEHYIWTDPADGSTTTECREVALPYCDIGGDTGLTPEQAAMIGGAMMVAAFLLDPELQQRTRAEDAR